VFIRNDQTSCKPPAVSGAESQTTDRIVGIIKKTRRHELRVTISDQVSADGPLLAIRKFDKGRPTPAVITAQGVEQINALAELVTQGAALVGGGRRT
jgi:hypothetical protein